MNFNSKNELNKKKDTEQTTTTLGSEQGETFITKLTSLPSNILEWINVNNHDIIAVWNQDGEMIYISKSVERKLGYKASELLGIAWCNTMSLKNVQYLQEMFTGNLTTITSFNINLQSKEGKYIYYKCKLEKIYDEKSNAFYFVSILKDNTINKEAEVMMIHSEKMSIAGQLSAGIAHEIRNPLTSLKGFLQLLQAGVDRKEEYYKIMNDEINKIEAITSELLFISKPPTYNRKIEFVGQMINDIVQLLKFQAKLKNIEFELHLTKEQTIYCDQSQIKQVLINLIKNAIEAIESPGKVKIVTRTTDLHVEIDIIDEGPGIPHEIMDHLGDAFFTTKKDGTGLGLLITKQILEQNNGEIKIIQNKTKGSTFRIILPKYKK